MYYTVNNTTNKGYQFTCTNCNTTVFTQKNLPHVALNTDHPHMQCPTNVSEWISE